MISIPKESVTSNLDRGNTFISNIPLKAYYFTQDLCSTAIRHGAVMREFVAVELKSSGLQILKVASATTEACFSSGSVHHKISANLYEVC